MNVPVSDGIEDEPPDARPGEDGLDDDDAAEQESEFKTKHGDDREPGIAQRVMDHDAKFADSLGTGGADEILGEDFEHRRADEPGGSREGEEGDGDSWHRQIADGVRQPSEGSGEVAFEKRIEDGQSAGDRQPAESETYGKDEHYSKPETRNRLAKHREQHDAPVEWFAAIDGGQHSKGDREEDRQEQRKEREFHGCRETAQHDVEGGRAVSERHAEIAVDQAFGKPVVLNGERLIESEFVARGGDLFIAGAFTYVEVGGVAAHVQGREGDYGDAEDHQHALQQSSDDVGGHAFPPLRTRRFQ